MEAGIYMVNGEPQVIGKPKCHNYENCRNEAIGLVGKMWLCGNCIVKLQNKLDKLKEDLVLEE
jgi:hypothetical protein